MRFPSAAWIRRIATARAALAAAARARCVPQLYAVPVDDGPPSHRYRYQRRPRGRHRRR